MRRNAWLLGVLLLIVLADTVYWWIATDRLAAGYANWAAAQRRAGWTVAGGTPVVGGWPIAATLTVPDVALAAPSGATGARPPLEWRADGVTLRVALLDPTVLQVWPQGTQSLRFGGGPPVTYTAAALSVQAPLTPDPAAQVIDVLGQDLRIAVPADGASADAPLTVGLLKAHVQPATEGGAPAVALLLAIESVGLPQRLSPALAASLGTRISSASLEGALSGPVAVGETPDRAAQAWRAAGGLLRVGRLALGWGPSGLSATGSLGLDAALQPTGSGTLHVVGYARTLDALAAGQAIGPHAALALKAVLAVIAAPGAHAGAPPDTPATAPEAAPGAPDNAVDLPFTLRDRVLSIGQAPLLRLPALDWE